MGAIWVDIFKMGAEVHKGGEVIAIDEPFAASVVTNHQRLTSEGAEIVVLLEHEREGHVFGIVRDMRVHEGFVQAQMDFARKEDRDAFNAGRLRRFSPGFALDFEHPHTGEHIGPTVLEVSVVAMPFQLNLRPAQQTNPGVRLALGFNGELHTTEIHMSEEQSPPDEPVVALAGDEEEEEEETEFSIEGAFSQLAQTLGTVLSLLQGDGAEMGAEELDDSARHIIELRGEITALKDENTRMELESAGITDELDKFVALKRTSPELFAFSVAQVQASRPRTQEPIGSVGLPAVSGSPSPAEILELAAGVGITAGNGELPLWVSQNYPEQFDAVVDMARKKEN